MGSLKGYNVPAFLTSGNDKTEVRPNPIEKKPNSAKISPNRDSLTTQPPDVIENTFSLLPKGDEDYVRPAGMIALLPAVLKKALENDTPQSRAVIVGLLTMLEPLPNRSCSDR